MEGKLLKNSKSTNSELTASIFNIKDYYPNILIADDDIMQLKKLMDHIAYIRGNHESQQLCDTANDGNEFVNMYIERPFASISSGWKVMPYLVIISDLHMPGLSGF